ncbi:MAG: thiamine-phosphate kinase [Alphaproteobacteria bacterium]|jgi:thiamine-monophosphate kinase|nr:thiamine-phosphate kinase [Alphaproteobacteria bacterium]
MAETASRRLGEFERIARYFRPLAEGADGALALLDDAAVLAPLPGRDLVVTTDAMVEGVHYLPGEPPDRLARRLLRVNLSDLAAMGAQPFGYTLTTALPASIDEDWLAGFAAGLAADQAAYGISLVGGDSVSTPGPAMLSVTAFGTAVSGRVLRRNGARPGDRVFVSGHLGDGHLGLLAARGDLAGLSESDRTALAERYHLPAPRLALGVALVDLATAAIDLSDGLPGDLGHICAASGVGARIDTTAIPLSPAGARAVSADPALRRAAICGGDDYELLFAVPEAATAAVARLSEAHGLPLTAIGRIEPGQAVLFVDARGEAVEGLSGWRHF